MFRIAQRSLAGLFCLALALGGAACANRQTEDTATTEPATQAPATVEVTEVIIGRDLDANNRVTVQSDQFKPKDTVYMTVVTAGSDPNATLRTVWTDQNGVVVEERQQTISPTGVTEFHVSKPEGLAAGTYRVEVFLNGTSIQTKEFMITAS
jgi:hypothetical protein